MMTDEQMIPLVRKEFNLSEKITEWEDSIQRKRKTLEIEDVKEFIKKLKEELEKNSRTYGRGNYMTGWAIPLDFSKTIINKLAGKELI